jgi:hypothetical protein
MRRPPPRSRPRTRPGSPACSQPAACRARGLCGSACLHKCSTVATCGSVRRMHERSAPRSTTSTLQAAQRAREAGRGQQRVAGHTRECGGGGRGRRGGRRGRGRRRARGGEEAQGGEAARPVVRAHELVVSTRLGALSAALRGCLQRCSRRSRGAHQRAHCLCMQHHAPMHSCHTRALSACVGLGALRSHICVIADVHALIGTVCSEKGR